MNTLLKEDDDLIDRSIEHNPRFGKPLERRLRERTVSVDTAARKLATAVSPRVRTSGYAGRSYKK